MRFEPWSGRAFMSALLPLALAAALQLPARQTVAQAAFSITHVNHGPNSAQAQERHYVVLVSLDGFRWDYAQRDGAEHLLALGKQGVWAPEGMLPSYPSLGLPNRLAMVTGLYPGLNGMVADSFYDPERKARFAATDAKAAADGSWFSGVPLWSLAESQGMRTATIFWPGSAAEIAGFRPTYSVRYDSEISEQERIEQVLKWLRLPAAERPHFIALSFSQPDREGREFGPDAPETKAAVLRMDALIGKLRTELNATGLPVDLVVVSDHGMATTEGGWITLDQFSSLSGFETDGMLLYGQTELERQRVYDQLKHVSPLFVLYWRKDMPAQLHYNQNPREGDPVVIPLGPYAIRAHGPAAGQPNKPPPAGICGMDPEAEPQMKAIFFAAGPDIVSGKTVGSFENVNLYPWIAHMLGLNAPKSDGDLNILAGTLRDDGVQPAKTAAK